MLSVDTSALVKLYVDEPGRTAVTTALAGDAIAATQEIAYIEAHAAFSRAEREGRLTHADLENARSEFERDWPSYLVVKVSQGLLEQAVKLVDSFALRAYDAVHLAAAQSLARETGEPVSFACFDRRLNRAADVLGMAIVSA